jgi:transposase
VNAKRNGQLSIGLDIGDRFCYFCILDQSGETVREDRVATNKEAIGKVFAAFNPCRIAMETGTHSPWISRLLAALDYEVVVANAKNVRLIGESRKKDDRMDAQTLARLVRADPVLLSPVQHRGAEAQEDLSLIRARASLVRSRTLLINAARGLVKVTGDRLQRCTAASVSPKLASELSPKMQKAILPLLRAVEVLNQQIRTCDQ